MTWYFIALARGATAAVAWFAVVSLLAWGLLWAWPIPVGGGMAASCAVIGPSVPPSTVTVP